MTNLSVLYPQKEMVGQVSIKKKGGSLIWFIELFSRFVVSEGNFIFSKSYTISATEGMLETKTAAAPESTAV